MNQISNFNWSDIEKEALSKTQIMVCEMKNLRKTNEEICEYFLLNTNKSFD